MRRAAVIAYALALVVFGVFAIPFLTRDREQPAAVPDPPALKRVELDEVPPGKSVCIADIAAEQHSDVVRMQVGTFGKTGPPLALSVTGERGYRAHASEPGGYPDNLTHALRITPPPSAQLVRVCLRNGGDQRIVLYSAADSARSRARVTVDGEPLRGTPALAFYEAHRRSIAERVPQSVDRIATFRGPFSHSWLIWLLLGAFVLVVPLGIGAVLWRDWR